MRRALLLTTALLLAGAAGLAVADGDDAAPAPVREGPRLLAPAEHGVGELLADAWFTDLDGKAGRLSELSGRTVVVLARSVTCPLGKRYGPTLATIARDLAAQDITVMVLGVMETDTSDDLRADRKRTGIDARWVQSTAPPGRATAEPLLAEALGVTSTTECFVIDGARTLQYRGAVDDRYGFGYALPEARRPLLRDAIAAVLARRPPEIAATTAPGCAIDRAERTDAELAPTYHGAVSRVLDRRCVECHRDGESAPFALDTYQAARGNRAMIRQVVERGVMPPWFADPAHTLPMANDRSLSADEKRVLLAWIDADCPEGDPKDAPLPIARTAGWTIGEPDVVIEPAESFAVPADGVVDYQYVVVPTDLGEDRWLAAFELRPGAPQVVHHVLVFAHWPASHERMMEQPQAKNGLEGFFAAMVPGQNHLVFPEGTGRFIPRGTRLRFQIHYTPNGTSVKDRPRLGLVFTDGRPEREMLSQGIYDTRFRIPPRAKRHPVTSDFTFERPGRLFSFAPHMHVRGTAFRYELVLPDGSRRTLLDVPRFDFNWQLAYRLREPLDVPAGAKLVATGWYDNSAANPGNPDPNRVVRFGEQTWDEMMIGYFEWHPLD